MDGSSSSSAGRSGGKYFYGSIDGRVHRRCSDNSSSSGGSGSSNSIVACNSSTSLML